MVSTTTTAAVQSVADGHGLLELLILSHPSRVEPLRLVNDTRNWIIGASTYVGLEFSLKLPDEENKETPRAQLVINNVGRDVTAALESLPAGEELTATIRLVSRATPTVVDYEFIAPMTGVNVTPTQVTASIGPEDIMRRPAVRLRFDPLTAPGLFAG